MTKVLSQPMSEPPCSCDWATGECQGPLGCQAISEIESLKARVAELEGRLRALVTAEALSGVRRVVAGWNGEGREGYPFQRHPDNLGATLPKTRCAAVYALDEAMESARAALSPAQDGEQK